MKMLINGKHVDAADAMALEVFNPYTGKVIDTVPDATKQDVDAAVAAAKAAQKAWSKLPVFKRAKIIFKFTALVDEHLDELADMLCAELGKPIDSSRGELECMRDTFRSFAEKGKHIYSDVIPNGQEPGSDHTVLIQIRQPLGVVLCVTPFNFPAWSFSVKVAPALVAGNAAIVKPSSDCPLITLMLADLLVKAGVPDGVLQVVTGRGSKSGAWLAAHPDVRAITLTGSTEVGITTAQAGAGHLAHVTLELGGNDAAIILEDADLDLAADQAIGGRLSNNGQICCAPKRFLVQQSVKDAFTAKVLKRVNDLVSGAPQNPASFITCLVNEKAAKEVEEQVNITVRQGAKILAGGQRDGARYDATILVDVTRDMDVAKDMEIFGPVIPIIGVKDLDEALEIANASIYGLGGCVFTRDMTKAFRASNEMECGFVVINGSSYFSTLEMAFGGSKYSGIGREGAICSFDEVTEIKTIVLKNLF